jgi:uncharacterized membrane-anchored protein
VFQDVCSFDASLDFLSNFLHFLSIYAVASKEHHEARLNLLPAFAEKRVPSLSFCSGFIDRRAVPKLGR